MHVDAHPPLMCPPPEFARGEAEQGIYCLRLFQSQLDPAIYSPIPGPYSVAGSTSSTGALPSVQFQRSPYSDKNSLEPSREGTSMHVLRQDGYTANNQPAIAEQDILRFTLVGDPLLGIPLSAVEAKDLVQLLKEAETLLPDDLGQKASFRILVRSAILCILCSTSPLKRP